MFSEIIKPGCRLPEIVFPKRKKKRKKTGGRVRNYTVEITRGFLLLETLIHADKLDKPKTRQELIRYVKNRIGRYSVKDFYNDMRALRRLGLIRHEKHTRHFFYNPRNFIREGGAR